MILKLLKNSKLSRARLGLLKTGRGVIKTPFFMPIATCGSVKALRVEDLKKLGAQIVLGNAYHLFFKPGLNVLKKAGGLHKFMSWPRLILTDSGGFQVFSLAGHKDYGPAHKNLVKIGPQGVWFNSVYDGSQHLFTPSKALAIQAAVGSDIRMVLDVCSPAHCSHEQAEKDLKITLKWAKASSRLKIKSPKFLVFGVVQGALYKDLRLQAVQELKKMNFDGYALGGLAVGETPQEMYQVLDYAAPELPQNKPRYLMGVGYPEQIVEAVKRGVDMFDCVIPTREARHGRLYYSTLKTQNLNAQSKNRQFYKTINIRAQKFAKDFSAINPDSKIPELRQYSKAYLRHLFSVAEPLALQLATLNNVEFYLQLMEKIRQAIRSGKM